MTDPTAARDDEPGGRHRAGRGDPGDQDATHELRRKPGPLPEDGDTWTDATIPGDSGPTGPAWASRRAIVIGAAALVVVGIVAAAAFAVRGGSQPPDPAPSRAIGPTTPAVILVLPTGSATPATPSASPTAARPSGSPRATATTTTTGPAGPTSAPSTPTPVWTTRTVQATFVFHLGESVSTNRTRLQLQANGDLVIIDETGTTRWRSNTAGQGNTAVFQDDGHFVVYDSGGNPRWQSGTAGRSGAVLVLAADGDVDIVHNGTVVWSSNTAH